MKKFEEKKLHRCTCEKICVYLGNFVFGKQGARPEPPIFLPIFFVCNFEPRDKIVSLLAGQESSGLAFGAIAGFAGFGAWGSSSI
jgi:hypothetical protein